MIEPLKKLKDKIKEKAEAKFEAAADKFIANAKPNKKTKRSKKIKTVSKKTKV